MKLQKSHPVWNIARRRGAFTLVELLIVISIITILFALLAGASLAYIGRQHESNTGTILTNVYKELEWQWRSVIDDAAAEYKGGNLSTDVLSVLTNMSSGDAERAKVIWIKCRLRQQFPMNYTEIMSPVV